MLRLFNAVLVMGVLAAAYFIYALEHQRRDVEMEIAELKERIAEERETAKLLEAEWSLLTRPDRIEHLAKKHLKLAPLNLRQLAREAELGSRVPSLPVLHSGAPGSDPIGDVLKALDRE
jgi:cell division protein FtsL